MNRPLSFSDTFDGILELVDQLRSEEGCPWDQEQTLQTLSPLVLEECYELVEAIEIESDSGRLEELGDLFLHLAFQVSISEEEGTFTRSDVFASTLVSEGSDINVNIFRKVIEPKDEFFGRFFVSPIVVSLMLFSIKVLVSLFIADTNSVISAFTSASGRFQFSVENAYSVKYLILFLIEYFIIFSTVFNPAL